MKNNFKWGNKVFLKTPLASVNEQSALIMTLAATRLLNEPCRRRFWNLIDYGAGILKYFIDILKAHLCHCGIQPSRLTPPPLILAN